MVLFCLYWRLAFLGDTLIDLALAVSLIRKLPSFHSTASCIISNNAVIKVFVTELGETNHERASSIPVVYSVNARCCGQ